MNKQYYKKLKERVKELERELAKCKKIEEEKKILMYNLKERVKELNCLYKISKLGQKSDITIEKLLQKVVNLIPPAWKYPDITCARIIFEEKEFKTNNFKKTKWNQSANINVYGEKKGVVEIYYTKKMPELYEGPFLKEERDLINSIVEQLGKMFEGIHSKIIIEHLNSVLLAIRNVNQLIVRENNREKLLKGICNKLVETRGYYNAWIMIFDESGSVEIATEAGLGKVFLTMIDKLNRGEFPDCFKSVLKSSKVVTIKQPYYNCTDCPLDEKYIGKGGMSVRLEYSGKVYGIMVVSVSSYFLNLEEEKLLLKEVAGDIAFALCRINLEDVHKRTLKELKESEERYRILFEQSPISMGITTFDGKMVKCNKVMKEMLGYSEKELENINVMETYVNPEDREKLVNSIKKDKSISNYYVKKKRKDGSQYEVLSYISQICIGGEDLLQSSIIDITENKRMEEALRESEEKFRNIVEMANDGICIIQEGIFKYVNSALSKISGYSVEEFIGSSFEKYVHYDDREMVKKYYELRLKGEDVPSIYEIAFVSKNGSKIYGQLNAGIIKYQGKLAILVVIRDITERRKAEEDIRSLSKFPSENPYPVLRVKKDGIIIYANKSSEFLLNDWKCQIGGYLPENWCKFVKNVFSSGKIKNTEVEIKEDTFSLTFAPILDADYINIYGLDITERKRAEEALHFTRFALDNAVESMVCLSQDARYIDANDTFCRSVGYSREELLSMTAHDIDPNYSAKIWPEFWEKLKQSGSLTFESYHRTKDGKVFPVEVTVTFFEYKGKEYHCGFARDITERKRLEEQLQIRQRMDSLGTLAGGIAHDFNNILAGIIGYIDMLNSESDGFTNSQKDYIKNAMISCERAANLIRQFQTLSKGIVSEEGYVDVYEVANEVFNVLKETTDRLIEKKIDIRPGKFYVFANASELNQVFLNLGTNSVYAIEEKGVKIGDYIRIRAKEYNIINHDETGLSKGEYIHIFFEDNGKGMSEKIRKRAFDPLFTTKEKGVKKGQGLGLAMVYNIITRIHNGYVDIESYEGKGTTVHIYLPKALPEKQIKSKDILKVKGGQETILVVDDEEIVLGLLEKTLKKYGYNVKTATDGDIALDIYKEDKDLIDAVILDLTMPKMSGKMLLEKMLEINPDVKVIISSGHSEKDIQEEVLTKAKGYVKKPYKLTNIIQILRTVLDL